MTFEFYIFPKAKSQNKRQARAAVRQAEDRSRAEAERPTAESGIALLWAWPWSTSHTQTLHLTHPTASNVYLSCSPASMVALECLWKKLTIWLEERLGNCFEAALDVTHTALTLNKYLIAVTDGKNRAFSLLRAISIPVSPVNFLAPQS